MISLQDLTVGQVSGMIAAAVFVVQFLIPIALPIILLGLLRPHSSTVTESAVSWSVISRYFHSSLWPLLLRTDSAATSATSKRVVFMSFFKTFMLLLIAVAAVVTPLGLYEGIVAEPQSEALTFHYIKDKSAMGFGTPPRDLNNTWSRICGWYAIVPCPNDNNRATVVDNKTSISVDYEADWYDTSVPKKVLDAFSSGTSQFNESVSNAFDIQYRTYTKHLIDDRKGKGPVVDNGTARTIGNYQPLSSLLLNDAIVSVEGLIVDMENGGIGFRNHSAPTWKEYGSTWTEDILFIVPETVCVDTNLTIDFSVPKTQSESSKATLGIYKPVITDRGGFVNLNRTYPRWDIGDVQADPVLHYRAYRAAWLRNAYSMAFMNVTNFANETTGTRAFSYLNSAMNKTFPLYYADNSTASSLTFTPQSLSVNTLFGSYLSGTSGISNKSTIGNETKEYKFDSKLPIYPNPFNVVSSNWSSIDTLCRGQGGADLANITHITSLCGVLNGAARRKDGKDSVLFDPGSEWSIPMYTCMSTAKAIIKTVSFRFNGTTDDLSSLEVLSLSDKVYPNDDAKPLWGVENTSMFLKDGGPLWGLVSPDAAKTLNLSTVRKEALYLPGRDSQVSGQNLPSADFANYALGIAYATGSSGKSIDYSGQTNLAMFRKWQQLSQTPASSAKILNLIWTDVAANMVVGTKGLQNTQQTKRKRDNNAAGGAPKTPPVTSYTRRVKYKYAYGIPAFFALALTVAATFLTLLLMLIAGATPSTMRAYLQHLSAGRLLTSQSQSTQYQSHALHSLHRGASSHSSTALNTGYGGFAEPPPRSPGEEVYSNAPTRVWAKGVGRERFTLGAEGWMRSLGVGVGMVTGLGGGEKDGGRVSYVAVPNPGHGQ